MLYIILLFIFVVIDIYLEIRHPEIMEAVIETIRRYFFPVLFFCKYDSGNMFNIPITSKASGGAIDHSMSFSFFFNPTSYLSPQQSPLSNPHLL